MSVHSPAPVSLDRKRPRKPSHKVLECTIEEVSLSPPKKKELKKQSGQTEEKTEVRNTQVRLKELINSHINTTILLQYHSETDLIISFL